MLGLVLLEMAGPVLSGRYAHEHLVRSLREPLRHRRDQRIVLLMADGRERQSLEAAAIALLAAFVGMRGVNPENVPHSSSEKPVAAP